MHDLRNAYIMRARMIRANGDADNQVILVNGPADYSLEQMDKWLTAIRADKSKRTAAAKVRANKPADLTDACWVGANRVLQPSVDGTGTGTCSTLFPVHSNTRLAAGMPATADILKCRLKPVDAADYGTLLGAQITSLPSVFPQGVCDWTKPGVGQRPSVPWLSYAHGPGGKPLGDSDRHDDDDDDDGDRHKKGRGHHDHDDDDDD
jgi:Tannase-like family of unknown function (DUF6351)